jgi:hypothetical protein
LEELATIADGSKFLGVAFNTFGSGSQLTGKVVDFGLRVSKPGNHFCKERSIAESGYRTTNCIGRSTVGTQRIEGKNCCFSIPARICEQFCFRPQVCIFVGVVKVGGHQFLDLKPKKIDFACTVAGIATQRGTLRLEVNDPLTSEAQGLKIYPAKPIEGLALYGTSEQRLMVVLAVEIDEGASHL